MKGMNEAETRATYIDPAIRESNWGVLDGTRIRPELTITAGRIEGPGQRTNPLYADYVLEYRNKKLAVIEAKKWDLSLSEGRGQAVNYSGMLQVRFAYSSNGQGFYEIDMISGEERKIGISEFPTPEELWERTYADEDEWRDKFTTVPFEDRGGTWTPRYYQDNAVEAALKAIGDAERRILLTLATGTGKTAIAFQIAWKLFKTRWNLNPETPRLPRILFLADRNILANQAYNSFSAFPEDALCRITPHEIRKKGRVPKNASIFFTIFQTFMSGEEDGGFYFGDYPEDFFDLVIIDECHRGGANDESTWRGILEHFSPAVQIGLTATPKRKDNVDTYAYFGEPAYTYSLKQGINDGFLTPFRVKRVSTTIDEYVHTSDDEVIQGEIEVGKQYIEKDYWKVIEIMAREKKRVEILMNDIDQSEKTIVFCSTQAHAAVVRDLINQMKSSNSPLYCARVTANDGNLGEQYLREFQDNDRTIPTILTTSRKLSTGVDARNVRNIVLLREINSMIEFKQIIGRGTRLYEGKYYFTIHDFVGAHKLFNDPDWDGDPVEPEPADEDGDEEVPRKPPTTREERPEVIKVKLSDGTVRDIEWMTQTTFWGPDGKPMSSSEFLENLFGTLPSLFKDEDELRRIWSEPETRKRLLGQLAEHGFAGEQMRELRKIISAEKCDLYDVLAYVAYTTPTLTRAERAALARHHIFQEFKDNEQEFLEFVLSHYVDSGVGELSTEKLPQLLELKYESVMDAIPALGKPDRIKGIFQGFQRLLYAKS